MQEAVTQAVQLIQSLGFPIFVCVFLFWKSEKDAERHRDEMKTVTDALNNNTIALKELKEKMNGCK